MTRSVISTSVFTATIRATPQALLLSSVLTACGGGGSDPASPPATPLPQPSTITSATYIDVAGLAIVAARRVQFIADVVDAAFETALQTNGVAGTYPCRYGGTVGYTQSGSTYTFTVNNCDTLVGGARVLLQSGSLLVDSPVVQITSAGYFLTSAGITLDNAQVTESGSTSTFGGTANLSATVTSATTATSRTIAPSLTVERAGRADTYTSIDVTTSVSLASNVVSAGSLTLFSPRAPGTLTLSASGSTLTAAASDRSQSTLSTTDYVNYVLQFASGGAVQAMTNGNINSGELAQAIGRALQ